MSKIPDECPRCGSGSSNVQLLSTTNEWMFYCKDCDVRFNREGWILLKASQKSWVLTDLVAKPPTSIRDAMLMTEVV